MDRYLGLLALFQWITYIQGAEVYQNISAVVGEDPELPCLGDKDQQLDSLEWTCNGKVLLLYQKGSVQDGHEHPSYTNQVQLVSPLLHSGVFSLHLMNVQIDDAGIYECFFFYTAKEDIISESRFIQLTVTEQDQDTTSILTDTLRKYRGLIFGLTLALTLTIASVFALTNSTCVNMKLIKQLQYYFCVEKRRPRNRVTSSCSTTTTSSSGSEGSTKALIHIHRDFPPKTNLAPIHRPYLDPLPPFSHPLLSSPSLTSSLTRSSSEYNFSTIDLKMENPNTVTHISCPDMCAIV